MANEAGNDAVIQRKSAQETPLSATTHSVNSLRDVEGPDDGVFDSNSSKYISQNYRRAAGAAYVLSMGVCGIVLVALASSLKSLAIDVDKTSIQIGAVFLTRGIGAGLGNLVAPKLYKCARGKAVVSVSLFLLAGVLLAVPLSGDVRTLHLNFLALGLLAAIIDSGCLLMTRRLHGSAAGPWLGANTVSFGVSGALSPLIGWLTGSLVVQYSVLAAVAFIIGFILVVLPGPGRQLPPGEEQIQMMPLTIPEGWSKPRAFYDANKIDFHLCGIMFWFMGGRIAATAFLREFVDDTSDESDAHILIVCLWLAITLGRVIGLRDQLTLALARLFRHVTILCVGGTAAMVFLLFLYRFKPVVWVSVMVYGCFTGPALGYAYDLSTRVSPRPETSAMVAMFGITAGASIVPFLASFAWNVTGLAFFLPLFIVTSHAVPLVLLLETKRLHGVVSIRRSSQIDAASVATPTPTFGAPPSPTSCWSPAGSHFDEGSDDEEDRVVRERGAPEGVEMG